MAGPGPGSAASLSQGQVPGRPPPAPYRGMFDALVRIGKEEGWRGYYKGLGPSLVLVGLRG